MTYSPQQSDLDEPTMPPEWRDVADAVMPLNVERMREAAEDMGAAMARLSVIFEDRVTPIMQRLAEQLRSLFDRPRVRRTGHRHRGSRDWTLRYAPARKDVPLGLRTMAKRG